MKRQIIAMQTILSIDTSSNQEIKVGLTIDGKRYLRKQELDQRRAQVVLPMIEKVLEEHRLLVSDIAAIEVNPGPGSFTGLRVGIAIANILGFLLQVPVNDKRVGEVIDAHYI